MILPPVGVRVPIATRPVDFRRGADGLAATVQTMLRQDPFCGAVFVFRSKRADRVKLLVYDGTGVVLIWKRLDGAKFSGRKHKLPHKRGSSEPEGCVRCSPAATRRHVAMARLAVEPAPGSWPPENGASLP